ncbi:MAG TPA: lipid-binding protein [Puia sp.]|nr:lipid-binding protein [Puia sp.]
MRKISFIIGLGVLLFSVSCKRTLPDYGGTATPKMSNGWWATLTVDGVDVYNLGTFFFSTYNTSENQDSIWLDDLKNGYGFKSKVHVDYKSLTFTVSGSGNLYYVGTPVFPASVTITGGKVLPKAGHSKTGVATDSLYMKAVFSDDPTTTYEIKGTARTGFVDDDY